MFSCNLSLEQQYFLIKNPAALGYVSQPSQSSILFSLKDNNPLYAFSNAHSGDIFEILKLNICWSIWCHFMNESSKCCIQHKGNSWPEMWLYHLMLLRITVNTNINISNCGNTYVGLLTKIVPLPDLGVSLPWVSNDRQPTFYILLTVHLGIIM